MPPRYLSVVATTNERRPAVIALIRQAHRQAAVAESAIAGEINVASDRPVTPDELPAGAYVRSRDMRAIVGEPLTPATALRQIEEGVLHDMRRFNGLLTGRITDRRLAFGAAVVPTVRGALRRER